MGHKKSFDIAARCPLYEKIIRTSNGNIAGVQCNYICEDSGFRASVIVRCGNFREVIDYKEIFCDDRYKHCPYFRAWCLANGIDDEGRKSL